MKPETYSRPGASIVLAGFALFSLLVFVVELVRERFNAQLLVGAVLLLGFAEALFYLGRIAWRLDQPPPATGRDAPLATNTPPDGETFDQKVERHRAELRQELGLPKA